MHGKTKCYMHGGKTPTGFALPQTKTGKYSRNLPTRLAATYEETIADKKLWELNDKAALVNSRIVELLSKLDTGETGETWRLLKQAFRDLRKSINEGKTVEVIANLAVMENLIEAGNSDYLAWMEITQQIALYKSLSESERKHLDQMDRMITAEQVMLMIAAITDVIRQNVQDRSALHAISIGIDRLISVGNDRD